MAETFADLEGIRYVGQQLQSQFGRVVSSTNYGQTLYRNPTTMTLGGPEYARTTESSFNGSELVLYHLGQAKRKAAESPSIVKNHFDSDIETIIANFRGANEAISDIGSFLMRLVGLYEQAEARLIAKLGDNGMMPREDRIWVEDTLDPIGTYKDTRRGVLFALVGLADWSSLLARGEDGQYGVDACFVDASTSRVTRNEEGTRVTEETGFKLLCIKAKAGGGEAGKAPDGSVAYGFSVGFTPISMSMGTREQGGTGASLSASYPGELGKLGKLPIKDFNEGLMFVKNPDGTVSISPEIPVIPVVGGSLTFDPHYEGPDWSSELPPLGAY